MMRKVDRLPLFKFGIIVVAATLLSIVLAPSLARGLFSEGGFMPHIHCYLDDPRMVLLQGGSDFAIGISYMMISAALWFLVYKNRKDLPFEWMFLAFGVFIFSCGWTHFLEVWTLWRPTYWLSGAVKFVTAVASMTTAVGFFYLLRNIFRLIHAAKVSEQRRLELVKTHAKLEQAYQDLESFSYSLSHDIRAPLRAVSGLSTLVLESQASKLDEEAAGMLVRVQEAAKRMERLVQDVLALNRLAHTRLDLSLVDPLPLLEDVIHSHPELQPPRARVVIHRPLAPLLAEEGSLRQCLDNLLSNAAKFMPGDRRPEIHVRTETLNGSVRLWVEDNGIGIPKGQQERVFRAFERAHTTKQYEGTGVGLAIVAKAVERMGGKVGVESEVGAGSRFWIELRAAEVPTLSLAE